MSQTETETTSRPGIKLFRGKDAPSLSESGTMRVPAFEATPTRGARRRRPALAEPPHGNLDAVVYRGEGDDGLSLVRGVVRAALRAARVTPTTATASTTSSRAR